VPGAAASRQYHYRHGHSALSSVTNACHVAPVFSDGDDDGNLADLHDRRISLKQA